MEGLTPRYRSQDTPALSRGTDHARLLLRRAQLALAALAVAIAVPVGLAAGLTQQEAPAPAPVERPAVAAAAPVPSPAGRPVASLWVGADLAPGAAATATALPGGHGPVPTGSARAAVVGLAAAGATLLICWTLLLIGSAIWRSRLAAEDTRAWTTEWARIEPLWSRRTD